MHISKFRLFNYKSFQDSDEFELGHGMNVLLGPNNVGKTALLEGLSLRFEENLCRTLDQPQHQPEAYELLRMDKSAAVLTVSISGKDLMSRLVESRTEFSLPVPPQKSEFWKKHNLSNSLSQEAVVAMARVFLKKQLHFFSIIYSANPPSILPAAMPSFKEWEAERDAHSQPARFKMAKFKLDGASPQLMSMGMAEPIMEVGVTIGRWLVDSVFLIRAERPNVGRSPTNIQWTLAPDASNLPAVISTMQSKNPRLFDEYMSAVKMVLPEVIEFGASTSPSDPTMSEAFVWIKDPATQLPDKYTISLQQCGTGVSQVLAILAVAFVNKNKSLTLLIDEPTSFLHPGAMRKLLDVLDSFRSFQIVLSTHSPSLVSHVAPDTLLIARLDEAGSRIEEVEVSDQSELGTFLLEMGSSVAEVMGSDAILWVEGITEEKCFPLVIKRLLGRQLGNLRIIGVKNTGDFKGRAATYAYDAYQRVVTKTHLLPSVVGFAVDGDARESKRTRALESDKEIPVFILPRQNYECYLLNANAITALLNERRPSESTQFEIATIEKILKAELRERSASDADGAKVLASVIDNASKGTVPFEKSFDSAWLTAWLLENEQEFLSELGDFLKEVMDRLTGVS